MSNHPLPFSCTTATVQKQARSYRTGEARVYEGEARTIEEVVLGEPADLLLLLLLLLLGARSLEGLNLRVDPIAKRLIDAGPETARAGPFALEY